MANLTVADVKALLLSKGYGNAKDDQFETGEAWKRFAADSAIPQATIDRVALDIQSPCDDQIKDAKAEAALKAALVEKAKQELAPAKQCNTEKPTCGDLVPEGQRDVDGAIKSPEFGSLSRIKANLGSNNTVHVRELQDKLKECGLYQGATDGFFGKGTQRAVIDAQLRMRDAGFYQGAIDGVWGQESEVALENLGKAGKTLCGKGCPTPSEAEINRYQAQAEARDSAVWNSRHQSSGGSRRRGGSNHYAGGVCSDYIGASNFGAGVGGVGQAVNGFSGGFNPIGLGVEGVGTAITGFSNAFAAWDGCPGVPYAQAHVGVIGVFGKVNVHHHRHHHRRDPHTPPTTPPNGGPGNGSSKPAPTTPGGGPGGSGTKSVLFGR